MYMKNALRISISSILLSICFLLPAQNNNQPAKYNLPFKNTYTKEPLVAENEFRTAKPVTLEPKSFDEAKNILPNPIWNGHEKEIEMYWKAWEIAIRNIRQPEPESGFVSPYMDIAYNGNIFMWGHVLHDDVRALWEPLLPIREFDGQFLFSSASRWIYLQGDKI
jgi:hypothetical protein